MAARAANPTASVFHKPDHDHDRCAADALAHAEQVCRNRGQKLTAVRRRVLESLLSSHRPLGAYDVIEDLARTVARPAPITVYRALEFLIANGLVHRIESRNAFLACAHNHDDSTSIAFLICDSCGSVGEIAATAATRALLEDARASRFTPRMAVVEVSGVCAHCGGAG